MRDTRGLGKRRQKSGYFVGTAHATFLNFSLFKAILTTKEHVLPLVNQTTRKSEVRAICCHPKIYAKDYTTGWIHQKPDEIILRESGNNRSDNNFAAKRKLQTNPRLLLTFTSRIWPFPITFYSLNNHLSKLNSSHFRSIDSVS